MKLEPLCEGLGVRVEGLDLEGPLSAEAVGVLRSAYARRHLLLVHCPGLSGEAQLRFASLFGPLFEERVGHALQFVSNTHDDKIIDEGALLFHSDLAFTPKPVLGLCLYAVEVPSDGASTRFANAERAWRRLPGAIRERVAGLHGRHVFDLTTQRGDRPYRDEDVPAREPRCAHPIALPHPGIGREVLYVSEMQTDRILELAEAESRALLDELFSVLYASDNVYEHAWKPGDLIIWDNLALQHARPAMPEPDAEARTLRRVTLAMAGVADQVSSFSHG